MYCKFGLLGHPLSHSLSPTIHHTLLRLAGLDGEYQRYEYDLETLERGAIAKMVMSGVHGFNVTIPHKVILAEKLHTLTPQARRIGAVNTVMRLDVQQEITLVGHNTDATGFIKSLAPETREALRGGHAMLLGNGGAARAVLCALLFENEAPPSEVTLVMRSMEKAKPLMEDWQHWVNEAGAQTVLRLVLFENLNAETLGHTAVLINTTPVGMHPNPNATPLSLDQLAQLSPRAHVVDLIYNPAETLLMREARRLGCPVVQNGLGMLVHQAIEAFSCWTKLPPQAHWAPAVFEALAAETATTPLEE